MDIVAELIAKLCDDPGEQRPNLVEIIVISGVAIDAGDANALEELVHACADGAIIEKAHVGKHVCQLLFMLEPFRHQRAFIQLITGHSCLRHGFFDFSLGAFPGALS